MHYVDIMHRDSIVCMQLYRTGALNVDFRVGLFKLRAFVRRKREMKTRLICINEHTG